MMFIFSVCFFGSLQRRSESSRKDSSDGEKVSPQDQSLVEVLPLPFGCGARVVQTQVVWFGSVHVLFLVSGSCAL
jgi:hypothetical protein